MEIINKNIRYLREEAGWTQKELAAKLEVKPPVIGSYEEFRSIPPIPMATKIADLFKTDLDSLIRVDLGKGKKKKSNSDKYNKGKDVLAITVDSQNKENVEFVNQKASAGYVAGYHDTEFVKQLPKFNLSILPGNRTHRAFEITGDSMLPIPSKSIVVGDYVEDLSEIKDGECYIVITNDGIVYKRLYNFLKDSNKILLLSDNPTYEPYLVDFNDIIELWRKVKIVIDRIETVNNLTGNQIAGFMLDMQNQISKVKKKSS
jgi:transcriptional regulator with XRE-family HTH domain